MEFQKVIEKRRSIRGYDESKKASREDLEEIVKAAILAPSWKNSQVSRYHIAVSEEGLAKVRANLPEFNANNTKGASAIIIATIVENRSGYEGDGSATTEFDHNEWGIYDLGLATENMVLKAEELGLGTLIMGIRDAEGLKKALEIPENEIVVSVISVGYALKEAQMPKRKAVEDVARFI